MPRVLILSASPLSQGGGIETFIFSLIRSLKDRHAFEVYSTGDAIFLQSLAQQGIKHTPWPVNSFLDANARRLLAVFLQEHRPDLVHIQDSRAAFLARPVLARLGIPALYSMHLPPYYYAWKGLNRWLRPLAYALVEALLSRFTPCQVVYVGKTTYEQALRWHITPPSRTHCIPNGIDLGPFEQMNKVDARRMLGVKGDLPIVCCVARLNTQKMPGRLVQAAAWLREQGLDAHYWFVGNGDGRAALEQQVTAYNLSNQVTLWGSRTDVPLFLAASDIFVLPSSYEAGQTLAVMEAQAAGLPCVVSDAGDHRLMAADDAGFVFSPEDVPALATHLRTLLSNPGLRMGMGMNGRKKAQSLYGINRMASLYDNLYLKLVNVAP